MEFQRTKNAERNVTWGMVYKIVGLIVPFIMRTIILYVLGELYLGLGSLFNSILSVLNLTDLGIGTALVFAMYKPVAEDDKAKVNALLHIYKVTYYIIGAVVLVAGLVVMPFLPYLISGDVPEGINLYILYALYLASTVSSYLFMAYKGSILTVYQRQDITTKINLAMNVSAYGLQMVALFVFKNYYLYVGARLVTTIACHLIVGFYVSKKFPEYDAKAKFDKPLFLNIFKNTGALFGHKVGSVVMNSVDNILISAILGLVVVAKYNNYMYLITAVEGVLGVFTGGLSSVVGNYLVKENKENIYALFKRIHYGFSFLICICCSCFITLFQPFMVVWVGEENLFPIVTVILLVIYFFTRQMRVTGILFKDAAGLWKQDLAKPYIEIVVDLVIDIILLNIIGVNGAIISTIVASVGVAYIFEAIVIHKHIFKRKPWDYYKDTIFYAAISAAGCALSYFLCQMISLPNQYLTLLVNLLIAVGISASLFAICTCWEKEFRFYLNKITSFFLKKWKR